MMTASNSRWLLGALFFLLPLASRADPPAGPPSEERIEAARVLYHEARELHRQGRLREALDRALEAYRTASTPVTALQAGQMLIEAGRLVEARDIMHGVALLPASPRESDKGRDARQESATLAATLDARIPKIAIAGRPANVDVTLDGRALAPADPTAWQGLDPGVHALVVRAGDRACTTINVTLTEAEARTIDLHDVGAACRPEAAPAELPPASPPLAGPPPIDTGAGHPNGEPGASPWKWTGAVLAGVGAVAIGVGGYVALAAKDDYGSVAGDCPPRGCTPSAYDVRQSARSKADAATVTMIVGAGVLTGGVLLFFLGGDSPARPRVGVGVGSVRLAVDFD